MENIKIILVEDHIIVRDGIKLLLSHEDDITIVGEASSFEEMKSVFEYRTPDIVLLDINLPDISGIEICKYLTKNFPEVKTLILSMFTDEEFVVGALKAGAKGYLPKNTSKKELLEAIRTVINGEEYIAGKISGKILSKLVTNSFSNNIDDNEKLSKRETEVLALASQGCGNKEIADKLFISVRTVESHKTHIMQKLNLKSPVDMIKYAIKNKITDI